MNGIILLATNHSYYGKLAYNLLVSLKATYKIPVALAYDSAGVSHLRQNQLDLFDYKILCPDEYKTTEGKFDSHKAKVYLDKLSPFSETLFLDADTVWNAHKDPNELFNELKGTDFKIANRGYNSDLSMWVDVNEIKTQFKIDKFLDCSSEVIYWEKPDVFEKAREIHAIDFNHRKIGLAKPDEPCFSIALALLNKSQDLWKPSYWYFANPKTNVSRTEIQNNYWIISVGGAHFDRPGNSKVKQLYDDYVKYAFNIVKQTPFELIQKSKVIPERKSY